MANADPSEQVILYTDGACLGNPGPGGYGVVMLRDGERKELCAGFRLTTNNRMEMMAAIAGLESLPHPRAVTIHTDSQYLVNGIGKGWAKRWRQNGWMRGREAPAINADLWERLLGLCARHQVRFTWIRGHAGNEENDRCDALAVQAARESALPVDTGYEHPVPVRASGQLALDLWE